MSGERYWEKDWERVEEKMKKESPLWRRHYTAVFNERKSKNDISFFRVCCKKSGCHIRTSPKRNLDEQFWNFLNYVLPQESCAHVSIHGNALLHAMSCRSMQHRVFLQKDSIFDSASY